MRVLNANELVVVAGGDKWCLETTARVVADAVPWSGDGHDRGNQQAEPGLGQIFPSPATVIAPVVILVAVETYRVVAETYIGLNNQVQTIKNDMRGWLKERGNAR